jgi:hypothetical protein
MRLTALANQFGTDKGTVTGAANAYTLVYEVLFEPLRERPIDLLEIGLSAGGPEVGVDADRWVEDIPSIRMWHAYFPKARIHGLDISDFTRFRSDWFTFFRADCGDAAQLRQVAESGARFEVVIDDGSHASFHQQLALCTLFDAVKPGGLYVLEDLSWQPEEYERLLPRVPKSADLLARFLATGRFPAEGAISREAWQRVEDQIANAILFDEDQLVTMRRLYNRATGERPDISHYLDRPRSGRLFSRGQARRVLEAFGRLARTARADVVPDQARIKLAILQRK